MAQPEPDWRIEGRERDEIVHVRERRLKPPPARL